MHTTTNQLQYIERKGCSSISIPCGLSCTGQNTGGYYKCNKYESKAVDGDANNVVAKAKAELDRYLHYYQRYHGHDLALKFAAKQRETAEKRMLEMQASEKSAWIGMFDDDHS
jgi:hypothetical protein